MTSLLKIAFNGQVLCTHYQPTRIIRTDVLPKIKACCWLSAKTIKDLKYQTLHTEIKKKKKIPLRTIAIKKTCFEISNSNF